MSNVASIIYFSPSYFSFFLTKFCFNTSVLGLGSKILLVSKDGFNYMLIISYNPLLLSFSKFSISTKVDVTNVNLLARTIMYQ